MLGQLRFAFLVDRSLAKIAVIQVGKNNRYGHPDKEVLDVLNEKHLQVLRNDIEGDIKFYYDAVKKDMILEKN